LSEVSDLGGINTLDTCIPGVKNMPLQIRRGTEAERQTLAVPLVSGELLWITDDYRLYIGDGLTLAKDLSPVTGYGDNNAKDAAASIFTSGTHSGITFNYDGSTSIDATVSIPNLLENLSLNGFNITGNGNITIGGTVTADAFVGDYKGSISADDSTILIDALNGSINLDGTIKGNIIPNIPGTYDIGSISSKFNNLYISETGLYLGSANITSSGPAVNLPAGSTVGGIAIGTTELLAGQNYNINIVGDDSTVIVDTANNVITANTIFANELFSTLIGDVKGSVFGDDSSPIVNAVDNEVTASSVTGGTITFTGFNRIITDTSTDVTMDASELILNYITDPGTFENPKFRFQAARGSIESPTVVLDADQLATISTYGYNGSDYVPSSNIIFVVDDSSITTGSTDIKASIILGQQEQLINETGNYLVIDKLGTTIAPLFIGDIKGSVISDSSAMLIDATDGKLMAANINVIGETGNTPTDALNVDSWLEVTVNGATKYIPLYD
jgi:hypothetical protein